MNSHLVVDAPVNNLVMKIKLSIVHDEGGTPTHFGFMSFGQVGTYPCFHVALKSIGVFDWPFDFPDK